MPILVLVGLVLVVAAVGGGPCARAADSDAGAVDAAFRRAFLAGDVDALISLFAADALRRRGARAWAMI